MVQVHCPLVKIKRNLALRLGQKEVAVPAKPSKLITCDFEVAAIRVTRFLRDQRFLVKLCGLSARVCVSQMMNLPGTSEEQLVFHFQGSASTLSI